MRQEVQDAAPDYESGPDPTWSLAASAAHLRTPQYAARIGAPGPRDSDIIRVPWPS